MLWDVATGKVRATPGATNDWWFPSRSPNGRTLASGHGISSMSTLLRAALVGRGDGRNRARPDGREYVVYGLAFSPDGRTLASAGADGLVMLRRTAFP